MCVCVCTRSLDACIDVMLYIFIFVKGGRN
jgi:hypothetical protein